MTWRILLIFSTLLEWVWCQRTRVKQENDNKSKEDFTIDLARKVKGKPYYWRGGRSEHTTPKGSELIANLITEDLLKIIKKKN